MKRSIVITTSLGLLAIPIVIYSLGGADFTTRGMGLSAKESVKEGASAEAGEASPSSSHHSSRGGRSAVAGDKGASNRPTSPEEEARLYPGKPTEAEMKQRFEELESFGKDKERLGDELRALLADLTPANWRAAWRGATSDIGVGAFPTDAWIEFLKKVGEVGGAEAMRLNTPEDALMGYECNSARYAMQGWAAKDREAAMEYLKSLPDGKFKDGLCAGFFRSYEGLSRPRLDQLFGELPETLYSQIATTLARDFVRWEAPQGRQAVLNWFEQQKAQLDPSSAQFQAIKQAVDLDGLERAEFDKNPELARDLAKTFFADPSACTDRTLANALAVLALYEPANALTAAAKLAAARPALIDSMPSVITMAVRADLGSPGDWLNRHPNATIWNETAAAYALEIAKEKEYEAAKVWASAITNLDLRKRVLGTLTGKKK